MPICAVASACRPPTRPVADPRAPDRTLRIPAVSPAGLHRFAAHDWQGAGARTTVCVHGLTRNGRDFDYLAGALVEGGRRVLAPDMVGRGQSDWLADAAHYHPGQYVQDMVGVFGLAEGQDVDWVGTSMGGLIGMLIAAQNDSPIQRLVLNDVGPFVPQSALEDIVAGLGERLHDDRAGLADEFRQASVGWGELPEPVWEHMVEHGTRRTADGKWARAYDPGLAVPYASNPPADVDLWPVWQAISCPILVMRGQHSPILPADVAARMAERPNTALIDVPDCAHAPSLMVDDQITQVVDWLNA